MSYVKARIAKLKDKDKIVNLIMDEVYISKQVTFVNGKYFGVVNGQVTKTLLCVMIKSIAGGYWDVIAMKLLQT